MCVCVYIYIYIYIYKLRNINTVCGCKAERYTYRVIQEESAILWEMIVFVILSKKVQMNMGPILDVYGFMGIY